MATLAPRIYYSIRLARPVMPLSKSLKKEMTIRK